MCLFTLSTSCRNPHAVVVRLAQGGEVGAIPVKSAYTIEWALRKEVKDVTGTRIKGTHCWHASLCICIYSINNWKFEPRLQVTHQSCLWYCFRTRTGVLLSKMAFYFGYWKFWKEGNFISPGQRVAFTHCEMLLLLVLVVLKWYLRTLRGSREPIQRKAKASFTGPWGLEGISTQFASEGTHFK